MIPFSVLLVIALFGGFGVGFAVALMMMDVVAYKAIIGYFTPLERAKRARQREFDRRQAEYIMLGVDTQDAEDMVRRELALEASAAIAAVREVLGSPKR